MVCDDLGGIVITTDLITTSGPEQYSGTLVFPFVSCR